MKLLIISGTSQRWANLLAAAILLLMFSAFAILSFGMLTLPFAVGLLLLSIGKLGLGRRMPNAFIPAKRDRCIRFGRVLTPV